MENSIKKSSSGQVLSVLSFILSTIAIISAGLCCVTTFISPIIGIPFGLLAVFLGFVSVISATIGMSQARKSNSSLLISQIGLWVGIIAVAIVVVFILVIFYWMGTQMLR
ncbi:hypothetical protein OIU80_00530 [Flavobacterium sp. LS1R47]|uniref:Uncharacterized protein n=1 Tax=Flavobacterium frigoritolerans TaxID=2987686 RepID=A0A9X2YXM3_9FLAO|nr:hypothetical protein [Flavobacterium frigoritolerans]MCV9930753.1 hypothetical protein [Flavobacterium frigoritolerans]